MARSGIVRHGHTLVYGWKHGWLKWMPYRMQHYLIVHPWNWVACRIWEHDDTLWHIRDALPGDEPIRCGHCLKRLTGCIAPEEHARAALGREEG